MTVRARSHARGRGVLALGAFAVAALSCTTSTPPPRPVHIPPPADETAGDDTAAASDVPGTAHARPTPLPAGSVPPRPPLVAPEGTTLYAIDQAIDDTAGTFAGTATITFTNTTAKPLSVLPILLHPNASTELGVAAKDAGSLTLRDVSLASGGKATLAKVRPTLVHVKLGKPLAVRAKVTLTLHYTGKLRKLPADANDMFGQAMGSMGSLTGGNQAADYGLLAVGDGLLTAASAYPMVAPYREGSFDTSAPPRLGDLAYNAPASFHVRTLVPSGLRVVTNLVDAPATTVAAGKELVESDGAFVRDFVLVAGRDLEHESMKVGPVTVTSSYRARDAKGGKAVLVAGASALASYERRFGPYPWPELDLTEATIVGGAGGVEFCSMALIAGMFYKPPDLSGGPFGALAGLLGGGAGGAGAGGGLEGLGGLLGGLGGGGGTSDDAPSGGAAGGGSALDGLMGDQLEFVVAHEVAHQYFAGIVGNDSRRFAAVDEPLAQYAAALAIEDRHGAEAARAALDHHAKLNYALYRTLGSPDRSVVRDSSSFASPIEYAALVYGKAPFAYDALRRAVGDDAFNRTVRGAVAKSQFKIVTMDEWVAALEASLPAAPSTAGTAGAAAASPAALRAIFQRYLREAHGDADLGIDDSGDFVVKNMFPGDVGETIGEALKGMGMKPKDVVKMMVGGGASGASPGLPKKAGGAGPLDGAGFDANEALHILDSLGH